MASRQLQFTHINELLTTEAKNDNDENRQLMTADIDNDLATTDFVNNQVIAGYDDVSFSIPIGKGLLALTD